MIVLSYDFVMPRQIPSFTLNLKADRFLVLDPPFGWVKAAKRFLLTTKNAEYNCVNAKKTEECDAIVEKLKTVDPVYVKCF